MSCHTSADLIDTTVEQGPAVLYEVLRCPPGWAQALVQLAIVAMLGVVALELFRRDWEITYAEQREMLVIGAYIASITVATLAVVQVADATYLVDVGAGIVAGYLPVFVLNSGAGAWLGRQTGLDRYRQLATGWIGVAIVVFVGPVFLAGDGGGIPLSGGRMLLVAIAHVMAMYAWIRAADTERERRGQAVDS